MTPEIKQRIEQIRQGEVPEGYKKGKLGIVPEEWNETSFSTLFTSTSEYTDDLDKYPLYSLTIEDGVTPKTERYERSHLVKKEDSYKIVRPNDYAYNPMNLRFGAVARHKGDMPVAVSGYYDIFTTVHERDLPFMDSFLTCGPMITYYNRVSTGSLVEKQRVHFSQFLEFMLPLPSINERTKIATILTTQDRVIELKEKRLAEKQRQKKYLVQQLLTGKKCLPGFAFEVEKTNIKAISTYSVSTISQTMLESYEGKQLYPVFNANSIAGYVDFYENECPYISIIKDGAGIGRVRLCEAKSSTIGTMGCIHARKGISIIFLYYLLEQVDFNKYSNGSTIPHLYYKDYSCEKVRIPDIKEQAAIAEVLSTADREIELLQQDIEQEKQKKKALMQLLLTGIVRVKT